MQQPLPPSLENASLVMCMIEERHWRAVGHCVRERRKAMGWTQHTLAKETKLSRTEIQYIESGRRHPKTGTLKRLCAAFRISLLEFMAQTDRVEHEWVLNGR